MNEKNLYDFSRINLEKICKFMDDADGVWQNQFARLFMDGVNGSAPYSSLNILFTFYKQSLYIYDLSFTVLSKTKENTFVNARSEYKRSFLFISSIEPMIVWIDCTRYERVLCYIDIIMLWKRKQYINIVIVTLLSICLATQISLLRDSL